MGSAQQAGNSLLEIAKSSQHHRPPGDQYHIPAGGKALQVRMD
jgi:hypothetical protein